MHPSAAENTTRIRNALLRWYAATARVFPWRTTPVNPYVVLVSECMLQQTQAARIAQLLPLFLERFPTVGHLARAGNAEIVRAWRGLGYNSRALRLRDAAIAIVERHGGLVPVDVAALRALPGVGPYTAAAVACFAYGKRVVVLDVNVRRVYSRLAERMVLTSDVLNETQLDAFAQAIIPARRSSAWHHAVMDLGSTVCTARNPQCSQCPLSTLCPSKGALMYMPKQKKVEPSYKGEPNRLWRGRIVEVLRTAHGSTTERKLFAALTGLPLKDPADKAWLAQVIAALRKDKIVHPTHLRLAD